MAEFLFHFIKLIAAELSEHSFLNTQLEIIEQVGPRCCVAYAISPFQMQIKYLLFMLHSTTKC